MILDGILNSTTGLIQRFTGRSGNNKNADLAAINGLADQINLNIPYLTRVYSITQNGLGALVTAEAPVINKVSGPKSQGCRCTCWYAPGHPLAPFNGTCRTFCCPGFGTSTNGVIQVTIPGAQGQEVGLFFSALPSPGGNVSVTRLADTADAAVFELLVVDNAGLPSDTLLNHTIVNIINFEGFSI